MNVCEFVHLYVYTESQKNTARWELPMSVISSVALGGCTFPQHACRVRTLQNEHFTHSSFILKVSQCQLCRVVWEITSFIETGASHGMMQKEEDVVLATLSKEL